MKKKIAMLLTCSLLFTMMPAAFAGKENGGTSDRARSEERARDKDVDRDRSRSRDRDRDRDRDRRRYEERARGFGRLHSTNWNRDRTKEIALIESIYPNWSIDQVKVRLNENSDKVMPIKEGITVKLRDMNDIKAVWEAKKKKDNSFGIHKTYIETLRAKLLAEFPDLEKQIEASRDAGAADFATPRRSLPTEEKEAVQKYLRLSYRAFPDYNLFKKIGNHVDVSFDYLLGRSQDKNPYPPSETPDEPFGDRMSYIIDSLGWDDGDIALLLNEGDNFVQSLIANKLQPSISFLVKLADITNTPVDYWLGRTDEDALPEEFVTDLTKQFQTSFQEKIGNVTADLDSEPLDSVDSVADEVEAGGEENTGLSQSALDDIDDFFAISGTMDYVDSVADEVEAGGEENTGLSQSALDDIDDFFAISGTMDYESTFNQNSSEEHVHDGSANISDIETSNISFSEFLLECLREKYGDLSFAEYARRIGITRFNLTKYLNNSSFPLGDNLQKIAREFNVTVEHLNNLFSKEKNKVAVKSSTESSMIERLKAFLLYKLKDSEENWSKKIPVNATKLRSILKGNLHGAQPTLDRIAIFFGIYREDFDNYLFNSTDGPESLS